MKALSFLSLSINLVWDGAKDNHARKLSAKVIHGMGEMNHEG